MPFHLTSDQELIRKTVRELAETISGKPAEKVDHTRTFPREHVGAMAQLGLTALLVPAEKGGAGTDTVSFLLAIEEASRASGTLGLVLNNVNALGSYPVAMHATDAVRDAVLPGLVTGEKLVAWALSEPASGSDLSASQTRARKDGDAYVLDGVKSFVVGAPDAGYFIVFAKLQGGDGLTAFLVPADAAGVKVAPAEATMAFKGSDMAQVFFKGVRVPADHVLGAENGGRAVADECMALARLGAAAIAIGLMQASFEESVAYSGQREQFRMPIKKFQAIQWTVVDIDTEIHAARLLAYAAADKRDRNEDWLVDAARAKLYAGDVAKHATQKSLRIHGGAGFMRELPVERNNRDARATSIYAGTSEMMRAQIAAHVLEL